jgi:osmoprotectant transport system permease protein
MPVLLAATLIVLWIWVSNQTLDSIEARRANMDFITTAALQHVRLTLISTAIVLVIAIPVGVMLTRPWARNITPGSIAIFNVGVAIPSIGLLAIFALIWDIGFWPAVAALVAYAALPVLRNTMVGLQQVDEAVIESARGMGMSKAAVLAKIELPLAIPVMLAGIRTAMVINVGSAALATFIGAGGLGTILVTGISQGRELLTILGAVLIAVLALLIDYVAGLAEDFLRPRGL